jgi:hypothetical protein
LILTLDVIDNISNLHDWVHFTALEPSLRPSQMSQVDPSSATFPNINHPLATSIARAEVSNGYVNQMDGNLEDEDGSESRGSSLWLDSSSSEGLTDDDDWDFETEKAVDYPS